MCNRDKRSWSRRLHFIYIPHNFLPKALRDKKRILLLNVHTPKATKSLTNKMTSTHTPGAGSKEPEQPILEKVKDLVSILSTFSDECFAFPYTVLQDGTFTKTKVECRTMHAVLHEFVGSLRDLVSPHGTFYGSGAAKGDDRGVRELGRLIGNLEKLKAKYNQQVRQEHPYLKIDSVRSLVQTQLGEFARIKRNMEERLMRLPPPKPEPEKPTEVSDKKRPKSGPENPKEVSDERVIPDAEVVKLLTLFGFNVFIFRNSLLDLLPELLTTALLLHILSVVQWIFAMGVDHTTREKEWRKRATTGCPVLAQISEMQSSQAPEKAPHPRPYDPKREQEHVTNRTPPKPHSPTPSSSFSPQTAKLFVHFGLTLSIFRNRMLELWLHLLLSALSLHFFPFMARVFGMQQASTPLYPSSPDASIMLSEDANSSLSWRKRAAKGCPVLRHIAEMQNETYPKAAMRNEITKWKEPLKNVRSHDGNALLTPPASPYFTTDAEAVDIRQTR